MQVKAGQNIDPGFYRDGNRGQRGSHMLGRIIKLVFVLVIFGSLGLVGYAYVADLSPEQTKITVPVTLNAD